MITGGSYNRGVFKKCCGFQCQVCPPNALITGMHLFLTGDFSDGGSLFDYLESDEIYPALVPKGLDIGYCVRKFVTFTKFWMLKWG